MVPPLVIASVIAGGVSVPNGVVSEASTPPPVIVPVLAIVADPWPDRKSASSLPSLAIVPLLVTVAAWYSKTAVPRSVVDPMVLLLTNVVVVPVKPPTIVPLLVKPVSVVLGAVGSL